MRSARPTPASTSVRSTPAGSSAGLRSERARARRRCRNRFSLPNVHERPVAGDEPFTVSAISGDTRFRVGLEPLGDSGQILIVAAPLDEVDDTLHQLLVVELVVAGSVLLATLLAGLWLVRVGLRPLGRIEVTAAAIAGGDLSQRVDNDDPRTEVGRLGGALNTMLGQIEEAFDERTASEQRLRRFVADASHELRTPLAAVRAYAELFDRGARERPDDLERAMTGIQRESRRMGLLVDDLLLLARLDQGRPARAQAGRARRRRERRGRGGEDARSRARDRPRGTGAGRGGRRSRAAAADPRQPARERARAHPGRRALRPYVSLARAIWRSSRSPTRGRASPTTSSRTPSSASTAATRRARATWEGSGSASRSRRRSPSRTAARRRSRTWGEVADRD